MKSLAETLEEIKGRFDLRSGLSSIDKSFIESKYERITGKTFSATHCGQCYQDAFIEMYTTYKKKGIRKMGLLTLKRGVVVHYKNEVYTRVNITDEIAAEMLKDNPMRAGFFEELPENWEELIKEDISEKRENRRSRKANRR